MHSLFLTVEKGSTDIVPSSRKYEFLLEKVQFPSHVTSKEGIFANPNKIEATVNWLRATNSTKVRSFVSMDGYYIRFVEDFSHNKLSFNKLVRKSHRFE